MRSRRAVVIVGGGNLSIPVSEPDEIHDFVMIFYSDFDESFECHAVA
jgi:hypothetical protein